MVFPFGVGDPRDDIDRVARELTGNQFRLKRDDPDAPQKFLDFVAQSEQDFMQVQQQRPVNPRVANRPVDVPNQPLQSHDMRQRQGEFVRAINEQRRAQGILPGPGPFDPLVDPEAAEQFGRQAPGLIGDIAGPVFGAAAEITTPADLALMLGTAGVGAPLAAGIRTVPKIGRLAAPLVEPFSRGFGRALGAEALAGTGAVLGAREGAEIGGTPGAIIGGLAGGVGAVTSPSAARAIGRTALRQGEQAAEAIGRTGVGNVLDPVPPRTVAGRAAGDLPEDVTRRIDPALIDPRDATLEELTESIDLARRSDLEKLTEVFGSEDEARRFLRLDRAQDSSDFNRAQRAARELEEMTDNLTPEQERLVYGSIDEPDFTPEQLQELRDAVGSSTFDDAETLFTILTRRLSRLTPERVEAVLAAPRQELVSRRFTDTVNFVAVREATQGLRALGLDNDEIFRGVTQKLRSEGVEDADIELLIGAFTGDRPPRPTQATAIQPPATARTAADVPPRLPEQAVQPQVADDALEAEIRAIREQRRVPQTVEDAVDDPVEAFEQQTTIAPREGITASEQLFGITGDVETGLTRRERVANRFRKGIAGTQISDIQNIERTLGPAADPVIEPLFRERTRVIQNAEQLANSVTSRLSPQIKRVFDFSDNGTIESLRGIDPNLPVAPTLQDVAARLPRFADSLTPEQADIMNQLRQVAEPYGQALRESGDDFGQRTDIMKGGFYLPRGNAGSGDNALKFSGSRRPGANIGVEQSARFNSMAEGIANGFEYTTFDDSLRALITRSGQRVADNFTQRALREARDEGGQKLGLTVKELLVRDNPDIAARFDSLRASALKLKNLLKNKDSQAIRNLERLLSDPEFDDITEIRRTFLNSRQVLRGELKGQNVRQVREALGELQRELGEFRPIYERAKKSVARNAGRTQIGGAEAFPQLNGLTFPERMAARANEILREEQRRAPKVVEVLDAIQRIWKAGNATLDNSGIGIQGLLNTFDNPRRGALSAKESLKAWRDSAVYSDWATGFNTKTAAEGRLSTDEWAGQFGLAQLGRAPDVASGILESIPVAGRAFQGADRAFATVSDVARAEWADDLLREELLQGKTLAQLRADGTLQQIANTVNAATGYVNGQFSLANLAMFSARFFTARILTMLRAIRGMDIDAPLDLVPFAGRRIQEQLPKANKFSRHQDRYARRAVMRMLGYGTLLTMLLNELQGHETDFRPVVNGRYNSNFLRFRAFNRDWSVFGPYDSLARMLVNVGAGRVKDTVRSIGNAPFAAMGMDLFENKDFLGRPIFNEDGSKLEQSAQILQYLGEGALPFAGAEAGELAVEGRDQLAEGDWAGLGITGLVGITEGFGIKSSPLSNAELRALAENPELDPALRAEINQELRERQERFRRFDNNRSQGQNTANRIFGGGGR
jgi:hypothetical protein